MSNNEQEEILKFAPFTTQIDVSFFQEVASRKLNNWGKKRHTHNILSKKKF